MRIERLVVLSSVLALAISVGAVTQAAGPATLRVGDVDGANATFVFGANGKQRAIVLHTRRIGVAGSRIEVTVDHFEKPVFSHVFAPAECKFGDRGSACKVIIPAKDAAYRAILARFKRGHLARVTIQDAGVMKMDQTVSLSGLAKALR
jgi:hypothetical protein